MGLALLSGFGSGALHAVTGPDHVLSLTPFALAKRQAAFRLGISWGVGHALGTVALVTLLSLAAAHVQVQAVSAWSERLAGLALIAMGLWSFSVARRGRASGAGEDSSRGVLGIGLIHGLTGAAALVMLLPAVFASGLALRLAYLGAFSVGSTLAMGGLTWAVARTAGRKLRHDALGRAQKIASLLSVVLGAGYLAIA